MSQRKHPQFTKAELLSNFWSAPNEALLDRKTTAAGVCRSLNWLEQSAITGGFVPFLKLGRRCLYRKSDVLAWLDGHQRVRSTSELGGGHVQE